MFNHQMMESARTLSTNVPRYNSKPINNNHNDKNLPPLVHQMTTTSSAAHPEPTPQLPGKYREFFLPSAHALVKDWYYKVSNSAQRHVFKELIKEVLEFDEAAAAASLRPTFQTDIVSASALVSANGGNLLSDAVRDRCVLFLSYQKKSRQQQFRETFGLIQAPNIRAPPITQTQTKLDFQPTRVVSESTYRSGPILAQDRIKKPSDVTTAQCEILGPLGASSYGTMFPWKVASRGGTNIQQKAHEASLRGPPWGVVECVDGHWQTHTRESFAGHEYRFDQPELLQQLDKSADPNVDAKKAWKYQSGPGLSIGKRRYQNYNDNYCDALLHLDRQRRKGQVQIPDEKAVEESVKKRQIPAVTFAYNK